MPLGRVLVTEPGVERDQLLTRVDKGRDELVFHLRERQLVRLRDGLDLIGRAVGRQHRVHILPVEKTLQDVGNREIAQLELVDSRARHFGFVGNHR